MGCLNMTIQPLPQSQLTVQLPEPPRMTVQQLPQARITVAMLPQATMTVQETQPATMAVQQLPPPRITIGEVCSIGDGTIYVLAGPSGPIRTKNGGFIILPEPTD